MKNTSKIVLLTVGILFAFTLTANAINPFDIEYPIPELGNCTSQDECKTYCDDPQNRIACFEFAKGAGLIPEDELRRIEDMKRFEEERRVISGPGGCSNHDECEAYCKAPEHANECISFSVSEGYMTQEEADRILSEINRKGPGGCSSHEECDTFCRKPENNVECMRFAVEDGHMTQEEADFMIEMMNRHKEFEDGMPHGPGGPDGPLGPGGPHGGPDDEFNEKKALELLESGVVGPGGCTNMNECEAYCGYESEHEEECMDFAIEHGLMPPEIAEKFKRIMTEGGPGGCKGQLACDTYCSDERNQEECFEFAKKHDLIPKGELEMMEKMMNRGGPGGCRGQRECDEYCNNKDNGEECIRFSVEMGMMTQEEADRMIDFIGRMDERGDDMRDRGFDDHRGSPDSGFDHRRDEYRPSQEDEYGRASEFNLFEEERHKPNGGWVPPAVCNGLSPYECDELCYNDPAACGKEAYAPDTWPKQEPCEDDQDCGPSHSFPSEQCRGDDCYTHQDMQYAPPTNNERYMHETGSEQYDFRSEDNFQSLTPPPPHNDTYIETPPNEELRPQSNLFVNSLASILDAFQALK